MDFLKNINFCKYNLIFFIILLFLIFYQYMCINSISKNINNKELISESLVDVNMNETINKKSIVDKINQTINKIYKADIESIRNLSNISDKLQKGVFTVQGDLSVLGSFNYLPKGTIVAYAYPTAPQGWAICNGQNGTPNLTNRFIYGAGNKQINNTGGSETVKLDDTQIPSHAHKVNGSTSANGNHSHSFGVGGGGGSSGGGRGTTSGYTCGSCAFNANTDGNGNHSHTFNVTSEKTGGNQAHDNMPPFFVLNYIMKL